MSDNVEVKENGKVNIEDAKKALEAHAKENAEKCRQEIQVILEKYGCSILAQIVIGQK